MSLNFLHVQEQDRNHDVWCQQYRQGPYIDLVSLFTYARPTVKNLFLSFNDLEMVIDDFI